MATYFTADLHFNHAGVINFDKRPFGDVEEMNRSLVQYWNGRVTPKDEVYILGDFSMSKKDTLEFAPKLKGRKYLILGNHDKKCPELRDVFEDVYEYRKIHLNKQTVILSHYFMPSYDGQHRGGVMLYGHSHNTPVSEAEERVKDIYRENNIPIKAYNAGCMYFGYTPATLDEIVAYWKGRNFQPRVDRQGEVQDV